MIKMSRSFWVLAAAAIGAVAGCCGSGPTHKCDFTPPPEPGIDGGPDAPLACGTQVCELTRVCCLKKVPLVALCIEPAQFESNGCEKLELPCTVPADCPQGLVCCVQLTPVPGVTCLPPQICPGDGVSTYLACADDSGCPRIGSICQVIGSGEDGLELKICTP